MARPNKHQKRYENSGRPTKMNSETVGKLEQAFSIRCNVAEACSYAGISWDTY